MVHLLWIIGDGALFFFLLMNWQAMCTPDEDGLCEPRNWWYNLSIQVRPQHRHTAALLHRPPAPPPLRTPSHLPRYEDRLLRVRIVQVLNVLFTYGVLVTMHGQSAVWPVPQLGSCASSGRAWRLRAARHSQGEAGPLGARPLPQALDPAASKAANSTAFDPLTLALALTLTLTLTLIR